MSSASAKQAAMLLSRVRHTGEKLAAIPEALVPQDRAAAYAIQDELLALEGGDVGGWKVSAGSEPPPLASPLLKAAYVDNGATLDLAKMMLTRVEVEVGLRLKADLLPRPNGYSRQEVIDAIEGLVPALEVLGDRFAAGTDMPKLLAISDFQYNAAVVTGPLKTDWQGMDLANLHLKLTIGTESWEVATGTALDGVIDAIVSLANEGAHRQGGLTAGQVIITGSRLIQPLGKPGDKVSATLEGLGSVSITLA